MIESDVRTYLLADPDVAALIGARIYPMPLPQEATLPAVTYQRVFGAEGIDHQGPSGLGRARLQFDAWAKTYGEAVAVSEEVRKALRVYPGTRIVNVMDLPEPEVALRRRMVEVSTWYQEA